MDNTYPIEVSDKFGQEETIVFLEDGHRTRMKFRGVWFEGLGLTMNGFKPVEGTEPALLQQFDLSPDGRLHVFLKLKTRIPRSVWKKRSNPIHVELDKLLDAVSDALLSPEQHPNVWQPFLALPAEYLQELVSTTYIKDRVAGMALHHIGYPKLKAYLPQLLEFLQDINWPAARPVGELLSSIGEPVVPHIKYVFEHASDDTIWHLWILSYVVSPWPTDLIMKLQEELLQIAEKHYDGEGADLEAIRILGLHQLVGKDRLSNMLNAKRKEVYERYLEEVRAVEESGENEEWLQRIQQGKEEYVEKGKRHAKSSYNSGIEDIDELAEELL